MDANFPSILHKKNYFFLFYTPIFTKHSRQFIYSTHLFNKIFILLQFFIILSLIASLSHRPNPKPIQSPISPSLLLSLTNPILVSLSLSHQPNNNYNPPFHNKITTKHQNNIPFSLSQIFS